ncbi:MAG: site-specific integrase [Armatimonadetes bacterium]|nr:site-specific integrase [Armatimonadota bacterium]
MPKNLVPPSTQLSISAEDYVQESKAERTRAAYQRDWRLFAEWCVVHGYEALPASPETVALYLTDMAAALKPITLGRRLASISVMHQNEQHDSPTGNIVVRNTLTGIKRHYGTAQTRKAPIRAPQLRRAVDAMPDDTRGLRDKAILLVGYIGALRRSEVVAIDVEDIVFVDQGMKLTVRRSKTDQQGRGVAMGIGYGEQASTCPVRALRAWIEAAGITSGPVFRPVNRAGIVKPTRLDDKEVALIIKDIADKIGINPDTVSGHSLRAGFITDQYSVGTAEAVIMDRSRHKSHAVMSNYRREASLFAFNYAAKVSL